MELVINYICQIAFSVGAIFIFGLLIMLLRKLFCRLTGSGGNKALLITGVVGTPVHELSHALMCIIFRHKITKIKLYQPNSTDGTLGYVNHSYNPKNLYHQVGNFFIGIAPIICGNAILLLLMLLLVPEVFSAVSAELSLFDPSFLHYLALLPKIFLSIFALSNFASFKWWLFIVLAIMISSHMELSTADIKGGLRGFLFLAVILLAVDALLYFVFTDVLGIVTDAIASFSLYMASFLAISIFFLVVMVLVALIIKGITKIIKR